MKNFDRPYASKSVSEFWRRWHISLSSWLRDYVFFPVTFRLSHLPKINLYIGIMATFLLSGIWHGAGWTFITMGLVYGTYICIGTATKQYRDTLASRIGLDKFPKIRSGIQICCTFLLVALAWIFFRSQDMREAWGVLYGAFSRWNIQLDPAYLKEHVFSGMNKWQVLAVSCSVLLMGICQFIESERGGLYVCALKLPPWLRRMAYYAGILLILFLGSFGERSFIYFQF